MTGQAHWFTLAFLILAALPVIFLWVRDRRASGKFRVEHHKVRCRTRGNKLAQCTVVRDASTGESTGIQSCSLQPGSVRCDQACLALFARSA